MQWMIENKKRLVVFSSSEQGPFPTLWNHVAETVAGNESVDPDKASKRFESADLNTLPLILLNHCPLTPASGRHNKSVVIQKHFNAVQRYCRQLPNFVGVEFVEQPSLPDGLNTAVLALNKKMQQQQKDTPT